MTHIKRSFEELITKEECREEANRKLEGLYISDETFDNYVNQLYKKYKYNYESTALPDETKKNRNEFNRRLREQERRDKLGDKIYVIEKIICTRTFIEYGKKVEYSKVKWLDYNKIDWIKTKDIKDI